MEHWKQRVIKEKKDLDERLEKLDLFMESDAFYDLHEDDRVLLMQQGDSMDEYSRVLSCRIARF